MTSGRMMAFNPRANLSNKRKMVLRGWGIFLYHMSSSCAPTRHQTKNPRQGKEVPSSEVKTAMKEFLAKRLEDTASANRNRSEIPNLHHHALRSAPMAL